MRHLRRALVVLALPLASMGFYSNPLVTTAFPDGSVLVQNEACGITQFSAVLNFGNPVVAGSTDVIAWWQSTGYTGLPFTAIAGTPTGVGNVSNLTNPAASFTHPTGGTDMEVHFDAGAVSTGNKVTGNWSGPCGGWSFTTKAFAIVP